MLTWNGYIVGLKPVVKEYQQSEKARKGIIWIAALVIAGVLIFVFRRK